MNERDYKYKNEVWAIIPARGGSKGVPRKNIRPLLGQPLIAYAIDAALKTPKVTEVFVTTDDAEIKQVSAQCGATIIDRPADLATDIASSESALLHALSHLSQERGYLPKFFIFMQCTSPFTLPDDLSSALSILFSDEADCAFAVTDFHHFVWTVENGFAEGLNHDKKVRLRRQDMQPQFLETGAFYAIKTELFLEKKHRFLNRNSIVKIPIERSLDIDSVQDFEYAEFLNQKLT